MAEPVLQLLGVTAGYGEMQVLQGMDLSIAQGECVAVIGRNGVGKTTTLATMMGLTRLHAGTVRLKGEDVTRMAPHRRAVRGLGLVPQTRDIFPSLTVEENLLAARRGDASLDEAYAMFPRLKERRGNGGARLSGGEQQMLAIARTLMTRPDVLLLDEPLEGLAPVICAQLMQVFGALAASGRQTILLVEQHAALVLGFAPRAIILDQGRIVHDGPSQALRDNPGILDRHTGMARAGGASA